MATLTIGIKPATRNAGVCVSIDGTPLEAVTVEGPLAVPKPEKGPDGKALPGNPVAQVNTRVLTALAGDTIAMAQSLLAAHADTISARCGPDAPVLWCVEELVPSTRRSDFGRSRNLEAAIAQSINQGALAGLLAGEDVEWVPSQPEKEATEYPESLRGPKPAAWRGRRGSDRGQQRAAWAISQAGLATRGHHTPAPAAPAAPVTPSAPVVPLTPAPQIPTSHADYALALLAFVRDSKPTSGEELVNAAGEALVRIQRPTGVTAPSPNQVAYGALLRVATHLDTPEVRHYLQNGVNQ